MGINIAYDLSKGILTFDVEEKVRAIFDDKRYLLNITPSNLPMKVDKDVRLHLIPNWYTVTGTTDSLLGSLAGYICSLPGTLPKKKTPATEKGTLS